MKKNELESELKEAINLLVAVTAIADTGGTFGYPPRRTTVKRAKEFLEKYSPSIEDAATLIELTTHKT